MCDGAKSADVEAITQGDNAVLSTVRFRKMSDSEGSVSLIGMDFSFNMSRAWNCLMKRDRLCFDTGGRWFFCRVTRLIVCRPLFWFGVLVDWDIVSVLVCTGYIVRLPLCSAPVVDYSVGSSFLLRISLGG